MASVLLHAKTLFERVLDRPLRARDHILRAVSSDGLTWTKDPSFRYRYASVQDHMCYYVGRDSTGELWFRTSVKHGTQWWSDFRSGSRRIDGRRLEGGPKLGGFCWVGARFYAAAGHRIVCIEDATAASPRPVEQVWQGLTGNSIVEDVYILDAASAGYVGWASLVEADGEVAIHRWSSSDGLHWHHDGIAMRGEGRFRLANNPCVVSVRPGLWRLYFRTGQLPAVGNVIRSAVSDNLLDWRIEPGVRLESGGKWDSHGIGFPFALQRHDRWVMYYTGFWGNCAEGNLTARYWANVLASDSEPSA